LKFLTFLFLFLFYTSQLFSCDGDCMSCHQKLMKNINSDNNHKIMITCIKCHNNSKSKTAECGADCFACHKVEKIEKANVREHKNIRKCRDCHMKMKPILNFNFSKKNETSYVRDELFKIQ
jgi:hypothetical protein